MDGRHEVRLAELGQVVTVKPSEGGGIGGWDIRAARHALAAVLRRRPEAYHATLRAHDANEAAGAADGDAAEDGGVTSIHDIVMVKEEGLAGRLHYDDHERRSGLVRFLAPDVAPGAIATAAEAELGDFRDGESQVDHLATGQVSLSRDGTVLGQPLLVSKTIRVAGGRMDPELGHRAGAAPPRQRGHRDAPGPGARAAPAGRRRQSVGLVRRPRRALRARRHGRGGRRRGHRLRQRLGGRRGRGQAPAAGRRVVEPHRDRVQLRIGLRARLPGQRPAALVARQARARRDPPGRGAPARGRGAGPCPGGTARDRDAHRLRPATRRRS